MNNEKIGAFIKSLRKKYNMTQSDLAEKIPINREAISKWECGRTIPDSSTILRLCAIFDVTADEIMYGEYKTKANLKELNDVHLKIYDDRNLINKKLKLTSKILLASLIILFLIIIVFLSYYFYNSYDSVKIYTIESQSGDVYLTDGILVLTGENMYFRLGNINGIDENTISKICLYYNKKSKKEIIFESNSSKDELIRDYYGYNEFFEIKNKEVIFDSVYVDLYCGNEIKTLMLSIKEDYSNRRLFFKKDKKIVEKKSSSQNYSKDELINKLKDKMKYEESGIYHNNIKFDNNNYDVYYVADTTNLIIYWNNGKKNYSITYDLSYKSLLYNESDDSKNNIYDCYYEENNKSKTSCDNSIIKLFYNVIYVIIG